jgi:hypothetical protein
MVIEAQSPIAELLAKDPVLLAKVVNDLQLALIHPHGNQQKAEWVENSLRFESLSPLRADGKPSRIHADPVSRPYGIGNRLVLWQNTHRSNFREPQ